MIRLNNNQKSISNEVSAELQIKQTKPSKLLLVDCIKPYAGHSIFEINLFEEVISLAKFESKDTLTWWEVVDKSYKNQEIIRKPNCVYHTALNVENLVRRVKRDYTIDLSKFKYLPELSNGSKFLKADIMEFSVNV